MTVGGSAAKHLLPRGGSAAAICCRADHTDFESGRRLKIFLGTSFGFVLIKP